MDKLVIRFNMMALWLVLSMFVTTVLAPFFDALVRPRLEKLFRGSRNLWSTGKIGSLAYHSGYPGAFGKL
jgi:hypothetical protein